MATSNLALCSSNISMEDYLSSDLDNLFVLDLTNADLITVIKEHEKEQRIQSPKYTHSAIISLIGKLEEKYHKTIFPRHITSTFWKILVQDMTNEGKLPSTIKNYIQQISTCLKYGGVHGAKLNPTYTNYFVPDSNVEKVYLTPSQVAHIYYFDFNKVAGHRKDWKATMRKVADTVVLSTYLGQRFSDLRKLNLKNFSDDKTLYQVCQQKTGNIAKVNLPEFAYDWKICREILEKYNYEIPYPVSINQYNKKLHEMLKVIGGDFDKEFSKTYKILGEVNVRTKPLWKVATSHIGRKTFVTQNVLRGKRDVEIQECTGHQFGSKSYGRYVAEIHGRL